MTSLNLSAVLKHNLATFRRQPWSEISGSLSDLGTFLPIVIALTGQGQISFTTTMIFTGIANIATGAFFGIPLPVQPMKAIAAVAILRSMTAEQIAAAGMFVSACVLLFSVTGLLRWFTSVIPIPVVKGIQLGAGLSLVIAAGTSALSKLSWLRPSWSDNYLWIIVAFLTLFLTNLRPRIPYALAVTAVGILFAILRITLTDHGHLPGLRLWHPYTQVPSGRDWVTGILSAGLGQLPLTTLNSIIAVTHLAADLVPDLETPSVTAIGFSVAFMNLIGCWLGAMPVCHGSGGLAAQHRFGARSGSSVVFLGLLKLLIGLLFGESLRELLEKFPVAFLTVMVIAAGLELVAVGESLNTHRAKDMSRDGADQDSISEVQRKRRWTVMMVTAGTLIAFKNDAVGFIAGVCCHFSYQVADRLEARSARMEDRQPLLS